MHHGATENTEKNCSALMRAASMALMLCLSSITASAAPTQPDLAQLAQDWARDWQAKKLDAVLALYVPDAVWISGDGTRVTGIAALHDFFAPVMKDYSAKVFMRSINGAASGDLGYDSGDYSEFVTPVAGHASGSAFHGAYLIVARRIDGHWRIAEQFWTESSPTEIAR
jgi:uncharacterized protein (TIGR02246 family)